MNLSAIHSAKIVVNPIVNFIVNPIVNQESSSLMHSKAIKHAHFILPRGIKASHTNSPIESRNQIEPSLTKSTSLPSHEKHQDLNRRMIRMQQTPIIALFVHHYVNKKQSNFP